jgi:radical SAM-linked protein
VRLAIKEVSALENNRYFYRLKYERGADVRYVSHLDMLKLFDRAARRGGVPVAYSSGFNPHPQFVFGMPLPVGVTSEAEYVDVETPVMIPEQEIMERFNNAFPPSVKVLEVKLLPKGAENIMKSVVASEYKVKVLFNGINAEKGIEEMIKLLAAREPLVVMKRTKSGTRETDIMPMIIGIKALEVGGDNEYSAVLKVTTSAGNINNLRPELAVNSLAEKCGINVAVKSIHRLSLLNKV